MRKPPQRSQKFSHLHQSSLQREAIARFAQAEGFELAGEFVEVETGKGADALARRPQLAEHATEATTDRQSPLLTRLREPIRGDDG
jgi:hypothetical protein